ncbi:MAG TPA: DUF4058 family protein [Gemmataceae bacterium]|nr:DUF4058 family protein [Gemmataceae bacterium]
MPIHDWTRVDAGIFHHFHHTWITEIQRALNRGLLPPEYYALAEQIAGSLGPDVLTLQGPTNGSSFPSEPTGGIALAKSPPRVEFRRRSEAAQYAAKAKAVVIHHKSNHEVIAVVEVVSPGNKNSRHGLRAFVNKAGELLQASVHLLILDLFPPSSRDPQGIHKVIWDEIEDNDFVLPADRRLTLAAYAGGPCPEAFVQPVAVGLPLPEMPLFLTPDVYIPVPLEATYEAAWADVPSFWQEILTAEPPEPANP